MGCTDIENWINSVSASSLCLSCSFPLSSESRPFTVEEEDEDEEEEDEEEESDEDGEESRGEASLATVAT